MILHAARRYPLPASQTSSGIGIPNSFNLILYLFKTLLDLMNAIWERGDLPSIWELANVIPIPKPGKDHSEPSNYQSIALTSCAWKTMDRIINARLAWFLESNELLSNIQCGFRQGRSTLDHLVRFETFIRNAFAKKEHAVSIFLDLEKESDTTWKYGILKDLFYFKFSI